MDDIRRVRVRTLCRVLSLIQDEVHDVRSEEERSIPSDATDDLGDAVLHIEDALDSLRKAVGDE